MCIQKHRFINNLDTGRCRIPEEKRKFVDKAFRTYVNICKSKGWHDDGDIVLNIMKKIKKSIAIEDLRDHLYHKIYVDEVSNMFDNCIYVKLSASLLELLF